MFPAWGSGLFGLAVAVIVSHVTLPFSKFSWRLNGVLSVSAAIIAGGIMVSFVGPLHRQFDLYHANLSGQWLLGEDLRKANLSAANLSRANLSGADPREAYLVATDLSDADLSDADLSYFIGFIHDEGCGNSNTKLPKGFTLKPCSTD